jgi:hypothetical protein
MMPPKLTYSSLWSAVTDLNRTCDPLIVDGNVDPKVMWELSDTKVKSQRKIRAMRRVFYR